MTSTSSARVTQRPSGLTIVSTEMPHANSIAIGIWVSAGSRDETDQEHGIAHMLEHMAFKGTQRRDAETIARQVEDIGGFINAHTSREETAYYIRLLPDHLDFALDLLVDILTSSTLPDTEIAREKGVIIQEIGQANDTPDDIVFDLFQGLCFPGHSAGRPILGTTESVTGFGRGDLSGFMDRYYGTSNMIISAAGQIHHEALLDRVDAIESSLTRKVSKPERMAPAWPQRIGKRQEVLVRDLEQTHVVFGWPAFSWSDPDRWPLLALSILYGGGMSSRLFQEVREKRGLCYSVFSFGQMLSDHGVFGVYAGTDAHDANELIRVACGELASLSKNTLEEELARAKAQMRSSLLMGGESVMRVCEKMPRQWIQYGELKDTASQLSAIDDIDVGAIEKVANRLITGDPVLAAIGDKRAKTLMTADAMADLLK